MAAALVEQLDPMLAESFKAREIAVIGRKPNMLELQAVPVGVEFNYPKTNVLITAIAAGSRWQLWVDDDLAYEGEDPVRGRVFQGQRHNGWQQLLLAAPVQGDVNDVIQLALRHLDSDLSGGADRAARAESEAVSNLPATLPGTARVLGADEWATDGLELTSTQMDCVARAGETVLRRLAPRCPLFLGPGGCGKTTVARAAAGALVTRGIVGQVVQVQGAALAAGAVFTADRDERLRYTLDVLIQTAGCLAIVEQFDLVLMKSPAASSLVADHLDRGLRLLAVGRPEFRLSGLSGTRQLRRRVEPIVVRPPEATEVLSILRRNLEQHPLREDVELADDVFSLLVKASAQRPGANPGAALGMLDALISRAVFAGQRCIGPDDVFHLLPHGDSKHDRSAT